MKTKETNLSKLSDAELDELIMHGVRHQEGHFPHTEEYKHGLNVVASAKEEKAKRGSGSDLSDAAKIPAVADGIKDTHVNDVSGGKTSEVRSDAPTEVAHGERPVPPASATGGVDASAVNQGIPGVEGGHAGDTPENTVTEGV